MRLLYVSPTDLGIGKGGRAMLARLHHDSLGALLGEGLSMHRLSGRAGVLASLSGQVDGATPQQAAAVIAALDSHNADALWLDGSNLGYIARAIQQTRPKVRVLTFCHNVETRFFIGALRRKPAPRAAGVTLANYAAERLAMRYSTEVIALNQRDSAGLKRLFGRGADHLLPMALTDQSGSAPIDESPVAEDAPLLFVGGAFYANQAGIDWFARHVATRIAMDTQVVGHGMDGARAQLERAPGIRVLGAVERLEPLYRAAQIVIAPIFDGSGMKTKVAEALMFGKHVIGTAEAFTGYADDVIAANALCDDADAFVAAIAKARVRAAPAFDPVMRRFYERDHSPEATRRRLAQILEIPVANPQGRSQ